jgi:hypothetical protein
LSYYWLFIDIGAPVLIFVVSGFIMVPVIWDCILYQCCKPLSSPNSYFYSLTANGDLGCIFNFLFSFFFLIKDISPRFYLFIYILFLQRNFVESMAGYSLVCYLLQVWCLISLSFKNVQVPNANVFTSHLSPVILVHIRKR